MRFPVFWPYFNLRGPIKSPRFMISGLENSTVYKQSLDAVTENNDRIEEEGDNVFPSYMSLEEMACQKNQFWWCWRIGLWSPNFRSVLNSY